MICQHYDKGNMARLMADCEDFPEETRRLARMANLTVPSWHVGAELRTTDNSRRGKTAEPDESMDSDAGNDGIDSEHPS